MDGEEPMPLLRPGQTCWRVAQAERLAVIVDAADYFAHVREAILNARHSVFLIGWDFDTRIPLQRPSHDAPHPNKLGKFLSWVIDKRPDLRIYVLRWDLGALNGIARGSTSLVMLDWMTDKRIRFRLDSAHPAGSAHHQKIIVIDDVMAFCGGIDMTADRWDTRAHLDDDPLRERPTTKRKYGPWHDVSTAVDGEAAQALGELARERWFRATGEDIAPPPPLSGIWPEGLKPNLRDMQVALSRTAPQYETREGIYEIEALYLDAIAAARRCIYIESQYFASRKLVKALTARLREDDSPEIIVINPESADGWLEEAVMGASRAKMLDMIRKADHRNRFRMFNPVTAKRRAIYVHAKVMIVDDRFLKVGSSNLNNRSMGFDTECDLSVEVCVTDANAAAKSRTILDLRHDLLAEHLGVEIDAVERAIEAADGSVIGGIESLLSDGRSLVEFVPPAISEAQDSMLAENSLLDPERPSGRRKGAKRLLRRIRRLLRL
ncbi:MAG: phospholipase D-like domain-containing protein [Paracoccaceae bacterium]